MKKQWLSLALLLTVSSPYAMAHSVEVAATDPFYYENPEVGSEVQVTLDGMILDMGGLTAIKSQRSIMVPVRVVAENVGAVVEWNNRTRTAVVTNGLTTIRFLADHPTAYVNDTPTELPEKPILKEDRMLVPMVMLKRLINPKEYQMVYSNTADLVEITSIPSEEELNLEMPVEGPIDPSFEEEQGSTEKQPHDENSTGSPPKEKVFIPSLDHLISDQE